MAAPFIGEIRIMPFNYAPVGWAQCDGQLMSIGQNTALFSLLGTAYGGDGVRTFALPDLRGRTVLGVGGGHNLGSVGGEELHILSTDELPSHSHAVHAVDAPADTTTPPLAPGPSASLAQAAVVGGSAVNIYGTGTPDWPSAAIGAAGRSHGHENRQPFLPLNVCIAVSGVMPSRS